MLIHRNVAWLAALALVVGTVSGCGGDAKDAVKKEDAAKADKTAKADGSSGTAKTADVAKKDGASGTEAKALPADLVNKVCPMSDHALGADWVQVTHDGKKVGLCCGDCETEFKKDPAGNLAKAMGKAPAAKGGSGASDAVPSGSGSN